MQGGVVYGTWVKTVDRHQETYIITAAAVFVSDETCISNSSPLVHMLKRGLRSTVYFEKSKSSA